MEQTKGKGGKGGSYLLFWEWGIGVIGGFHYCRLSFYLVCCSPKL